MTHYLSESDLGMADDDGGPTKKMTSGRTTITGASMPVRSYSRCDEVKTKALGRRKARARKAVGKLMIKLVLPLKYIIYIDVSVQGKGRGRKKQ